MSENFRQQLDLLPGYLANHLKISVIAMSVGVLVSLPAAVLLARRRELRYPVLTVAGVIQTIPSLALLALMVPLIDSTGGFGLGLEALGFWPAITGLTLYSILPMLRNAVTGIVGVDPAMTEAARGMGMTQRQVLFRVELPLAAPVIIAGIRTATVWVVGIATLATPVGQKCLGNYIFTGLQTQNWVMVMFGVVGAAGLAILLDLLIGGLEKGAKDRRRRLSLVSGSSLLVIVLGGLVSPRIVEWLEPERTLGPAAEGEEEERAEIGTVRIGAKTFTEQYVLAALLQDRLEEAGFPTERTESLGSTVIFDALAGEDLDVYVDYTGTIWANYMEREEAYAPWRVLTEVEGWLARLHGIRSLGSLGFENAYALAMRRDRARELGVETIADLHGVSSDLRIGGDYEFFGRPEWAKIRTTYGLNFADQEEYDSTLMYEAVSRGEVDVISAFSTDGRIKEYDLVLLEDPRNTIPPYDAVLLVGPRIAGREPVVKALRPLVGAISLEEMQRTNLSVDRAKDKRTAEEAARRLWKRLQEGE